MKCDSCGEAIGGYSRLFKEGEMYDCGYVFGIGACCRSQFEQAGYVVVGEDHQPSGKHLAMLRGEA